MYILSILSAILFSPIAVIGIIIYFVRRRRKNTHFNGHKEWYLRFAASKADVISQFFILLSISFLYVTLTAFSKDFDLMLTNFTLLFITSVISLISAYYFKAIFVLVVGLSNFITWWTVQNGEWVSNDGVAEIGLSVGLVFIALIFYLLGRFYQREIKWRRFSLVYLIFGIFMITGILFSLSSSSGLAELASGTQGELFLNSWQLTTSLFVLLTTIIGGSIYMFIKKIISRFEFYSVLFLTILFSLITVIPIHSTVIWAVFFNVAIFSELFGVIYYGYLRKETWLINLGAFFLFLLIINKYFDWFFTFLDKSMFFTGAGILLFALGWFMERGRRKMISNVKSQTEIIS